MNPNHLQKIASSHHVLFIIFTIQNAPRNDIKKMRPGFIYILTNKNNTTLYVGVSAHIVSRIQQHKEKHDPRSFTSKYNLHKLVYYEAFQMIGDAIGREKQLKAGNRVTKVALINSINPKWNDLYEQLKQEFGPQEDL